MARIRQHSPEGGATAPGTTQAGVAMSESGAAHAAAEVGDSHEGDVVFAGGMGDVGAAPAVEPSSSSMRRAGSSAGRRGDDGGSSTKITACEVAACLHALCIPQSAC